MNEKDFVTYEYVTKTVKAKDQAKAADMYEAFGWEVTSSSSVFLDNVTLSLKRDRKQKHKAELTKLERQAEAVSDTLNSLEQAKTLSESIFAYVFGIISVLVLGGGMCLTMLISGNIPAFIGGITLGVIGIAMCVINYPVYKNMVVKKTKKLLPVIDSNEEKLANILEKGNDLLKSDLI